MVREAGRRVLNMRHFDVQLIGGMVLHQGKIAEMKTGEGKTLVATLPCLPQRARRPRRPRGHGQRLPGQARRRVDGQDLQFLGLTVGVIVHDLDDDERREAYGADITYGTNNEFGFDYLRDNMKFDLTRLRAARPLLRHRRRSRLHPDRRSPHPADHQRPQRGTTDKYAAREPHHPASSNRAKRSSAPGEDKILTGDYVVDEKHQTITVTDEGWEKIEKLLGIGNIADPENWDLKHHVETAIKAHALYQPRRRVRGRRRRSHHRRRVHRPPDARPPLVRRTAPGHRSQGEASRSSAKNQTLATITFQNYFRMYKKLAGMTGTAETEAAEFEKIYKLEIVVIPTNKPLLRIENPDVVYRTEKEKYFAAADEIQKLARDGAAGAGRHHVDREIRAPLRNPEEARACKHVVLNAKFHEREAEIVAQAGRKGMVTIATNMAGRGTDILLGGNPEFMAKQELREEGHARSR